MSSRITASSVITLTGDLVTEHPIGTKIAYSILYLLHIISSFVACFTFCANFYRYLTEFIATVSVILVSWIATAAANLFLYRTIRPRGRYTGAENAPGSEVTAGICLRLLFTMLPFSPILRYIEAWRANKMLARLEKRITRQPNGSLAPGEEKTMREVQRVRRECRRRDKAAGLLSLFNACISAGTMLILLMYFYGQRASFGLPPYTFTESLTIFLCVGCSVLWLATAMVHFYPAQRNTTVTAEHSTTSEGRVCGLILLVFWHLLMLVARSLALSLFAVIYGHVLFAIIAVHIILCMLLLYLSRCFGNDDSTRRCSCQSFFRDLFYSIVGVFDFVNANQNRTRLRYLIFYAVILVENGIFVGLWYSKKRPDEGLTRLPIFLAVIIANVFGFLIMQLYYFLFFPETSNPGLLSFCNDSEPAEKEEIPPQIALKIQSSKQWVERQNFFDASSIHTDVIPPSDEVSMSHEPSVVNFQLPKHRENPRISSYRDPRIPKSSRPPSSVDSESIPGHRPPSIIRDARYRDLPTSDARALSVDIQLDSKEQKYPTRATSAISEHGDYKGNYDPRLSYRDPRVPNSSQQSLASNMSRSREKLNASRDPRLSGSGPSYINPGLTKSREKLYRDPRTQVAAQPSLGSHASRSREELNTSRDPRIPGAGYMARSREELNTSRDPRIPGAGYMARSREELNASRDPRIPGAGHMARSREELNTSRDPRNPISSHASVSSDMSRGRERSSANRDPRISAPPQPSYSQKSSVKKPHLPTSQNPINHPPVTQEKDEEDDDSFSFASSSSSSIGLTR